MRSLMLGAIAIATMALAWTSAAAAPCAGFSDVEDTSGFCANVTWLKNRQITAGCTGSLYCPHDSASRLQMAAFMNRMGTALTPVQLHVDAAPGAIDLDANSVVCQTGDFTAERFARIAYADLRFGATATADVGLAADLVMSLDQGATWANLNLFDNRGSVRANQWGMLNDLGFANLDVDQTARFGVRMSRIGAAGGPDLTASRCQLRVRIYGDNNAPPSVNAGANQTITLPATANLTGTASDDGLPNPPGTTTHVWSKVSGPGTVTFGDVTALATSATFSDPGTYVLRLTANDGALSAFAETTITVNPAVVVVAAPPLDPGVASDIGNDTRFLYTGANPIQSGVAPGTIDRVRAAVLRGRVLDRSGAPLAGVVVNVLNHLELGQTQTRADGQFDLAVNGGEALTVGYAKAGFLPAQRRVQTPVRDYHVLDDLVMIPVDSRVTTIASNAPVMQVHQANRMTDASGSRTSTLLFPAGTTATLVMPNGSTQPIASLGVRATEYTVGTNGPNAMPAALPPSSGYTYAVELSADEAISGGAARVAFSQPLFNYVDNFLGFPVGTAVPTAFYDRVQAAWIPSPNGRVIRITAIAAGVATVDSVGTGALPPLVLSNAELQQLASLYTVGQQLWRVPIPHFTPWDHNWPFGPPLDATPPQGAAPSSDDQLDKPACSGGSIIECENQTLGETIPLVGSKLALHYRSARMPGRSGVRTLRIPLSGASVPASLKRIELDVQIAGQRFRQSFGPGTNQTAAFAWDGKDAYGRVMPSAQPARIDVGYVYDAVYRTPADITASFGLPGNALLAANPTRQEVTLGRAFTITVGPFDARVFGLGGWSLTDHHLYDPHQRRLHAGDGRRRGAESLGAVIFNVARENPLGTPVPNNHNVMALGIGSDGSLYLAGRAFPGAANVRRVFPTGLTVAFGSVPDANTIYALAVGPDDSVYVAQRAVNGGQGNRISRIAPDGVTTVIAGRENVIGFSGDGGPAALATFDQPWHLASGPDGSLYVTDYKNDRIRRIGPDGIIATVVGNGLFCANKPCGDGGPATQAALTEPMGLAVASDGTLYFFEFGSKRIRRVGTDGIISTYAGNGDICLNLVPLPCGDGGLATQAALAGLASRLAVAADGALYFTESESNRVRVIGTDGIIRTVAGRGGLGAVTFVEGMPATQAQLSLNQSAQDDLALAADGALYIAAGDRLRKVVGTLPTLSASDSAVASEDGTRVDIFDLRGRHLRTLQALTGATLLEFAYDAAGRLERVVEKTGATDNVTTIERDAAGRPTAIVAPFGQRTLLGVDANGFLSSVTNPAGEQVTLVSTAQGLLTSFTDPRGKATTFAYDVEGRLTRDTDAVGGFQALTRTGTAELFSVARTTALGRSTTYTVDPAPGEITRTIVAPDASQVTAEERADAGTAKHTTSDGTVTNVSLGPDPRFGMVAPLVSVASIAVPAGPTVSIVNSQTMVSSNPRDPFGFTSLTTASTIDGRTTSSTYTAATRTEVATTPAGRTGSITLDTFGRPVQAQAGGLAPEALTYDARGRIDTVTRGSGAGARTYAFAYNPQGFLATITDPIGRVIQWSYDAAGRVISKTLPDGRIVTFGYDASSNVTSLTPAGRPAHTFAYSDRGELTLATPPAVPGAGASSYSYNLDGQSLTTARPDNRTITVGYDTAGRRTTRTFATGGVTTGTDTVTYDAAGRVASVAAASGATTSYAYAGSLLTSESWSGPTVGSVAVSYDSSFRPASQSVSGAGTITFGYDNDNLVTSAGALTLTRDPQHGLVTGSTLGVAGTTIGYNAFGEMTSHVASVSATPVYNVAFVRDAVGRITQKTETLGGVTDTYVYTYDAVGQITLVTKNGAAVESYAYDTNGNRINATVAGSSATGTYDAQDRVISYGPTSFAHTAAGELASKTMAGQTTTYQYDAVGNLVAVTLPGGTAISYIVDGLDRRVGKRVNGSPMQGFLYGDSLRPVAELDGAGTLVGRFVYAGKHVPAYVIKGGVAHRIVTDHLGSVRLVINANNGVIAQRLDYDTFGNVLADTSPGFQPFGFGGGIYDSATGLVRFGARDYDASVGRWTAKDPIRFRGGDANLYRYARNNPMNRVDPSGKALADEIAKAESMLDDITDTFDTDFERNAAAGVEPTRKVIVNQLNRSTIVDVIAKKRAQLRLQFNYVKNLFSGGLVSRGLFLLQAVDFLGFACRAYESGRSLFEQNDFEEDQKVQNGTTTFVKCMGLICYVDERI